MHFPDHTHPVSKKDAIVSGKFHMMILNREIVLQPGDIIDVPKDTIHNTTVVGSEPVVFFDGTKSAPYSWRHGPQMILLSHWVYTYIVYGSNDYTTQFNRFI